MPRPSRNSPLRLLTIKRNPAGLLKLIWLITLLAGEVLVFHTATWSCPWPEHKSWRVNSYTSHPLHVAMLADPQITDTYSYGRTGVIQWLTEFYTDMYMRKNWRRLHTALRPDVVFILGDLMDGGREWSDDNIWNAELARFRSLFRLPRWSDPSNIHYLAGNHDIGFGDHVRVSALDRFRRYFGKTSYELELGNHSFVVVDSISLHSSNPDVFTPAVNFLDAVSTPTLPRILLTHVPLYRPDSTSCGPLRRMQNTINQGTGHQYQNLVTPELTTRILRTTRPNLVFSGDDHDYCEIRHYEEIEKPGEMGGRVQIDAVEVTVNTFSMAQGVRRPGYVLLSLFNPDTLKSTPEEPDRPREIPEMPVDGGTPTFMHVLCLLPDQLVVYAGYGVMAGLTILAILGVAVTRFQAGLERAMGNREEFEMPLFLGRGGEGGYESEEEGRVRVVGAQKAWWVSVVGRREFWRTVGREVAEVAVFAVVVYVVCVAWSVVW